MNPQAYIEMANTESNHWWFVGRRYILRSFLSSLTIPNDAKILELGCGTGGNLQMLSEFGDTSAVEMDAIAIDIARKKVGDNCNIKQGNAPDNIPDFNTKFDLICMFDVLEHIDKDMETLSTLKHLLNHRGLLVITVPAYQWLYGTHDVFLHHKRRYYQGHLRKEVASLGFCIRKISYFNTLLFPLALVARLKDRLFPGKQATGAGTPSAPINSLFKLIFTFEWNLLKKVNLPFGVSLLCVLSVEDQTT